MRSKQNIIKSDTPFRGAIAKMIAEAAKNEETCESYDHVIKHIIDGGTIESFFAKPNLSTFTDGTTDWLIDVDELSGISGLFKDLEEQPVEHLEKRMLPEDFKENFAQDAPLLLKFTNDDWSDINSNNLEQMLDLGKRYQIKILLSRCADCVKAIKLSTAEMKLILKNLNLKFLRISMNSMFAGVFMYISISIHSKMT